MIKERWDKMNHVKQAEWVWEQVYALEQSMNYLVGMNTIPTPTVGVFSGTIYHENDIYSELKACGNNNNASQACNKENEMYTLEQQKLDYLGARLYEATQAKKDKAKVTFGLQVDPDKRDETGYYKARKEIVDSAKSLKDVIMIGTPEEALKAIQAFEAN